MEDIIKVSASELVDILTHSFNKYVTTSSPEYHPAVFLKGSPGIGKSDAVKQIRDNLFKITNKKVNLIDIRLILFNPVDLRGIPVADVNEKIAIWLKPEIFKLKEEDEYINILFLDELTSSPKSIQAAAYQIALDKKIGEHRLPSNTFVIAAGNKQSDNAVTYEMPSALKNRFMHFEVENNINDWINWAEASNINNEIIEFISKYPNMLNNEAYNNENMIVTPRSWERLSKMLDVLGGSLEENVKICQSIIGVEMTKLLVGKNEVFVYEDIITNKEIKIPNDVEQLEQLTSMLESNIDDYYNDIEKLKIILFIVNKLPVDYGIRLFRLISKESDASIDLTEITLYRDFIEKICRKNE